MATTPPLIPESRIVEEFGEIAEAVMVHVVGPINASSIGHLFAQAAVAPGIPQPGASLDVVYFPNVRCEIRTPRVVSWDGMAGNVRMECVFRLQRPQQEAQYPLRGGSSLNQVTTEVDRNDNRIVLEWDNPDTEKTEYSYPDVTVQVIHGHFSREIVEQADNPDAIVAEWVSHVNAADWRMPGDAGEWLCSDVQYELVDRFTEPKRYRFNFEFERKPGGWKYTVRFLKDGEDPGDLIEGVGVKDIEWHDPKDFTTKFAAYNG